MHWLRLRRVLWPWMMRPWALRSADNRETYITSRMRWDGAGAQIVAVLSNICFAEFTNITYTHTPFIRMTHAPEGMTDEQCAEMWERHLDLGTGMPAANELTNVRRVQVRGPQNIFNRPGTLYELDNCHAFTDRYPEHWMRTLEHMKRERWPAPPKRKNRMLTVAAHARRGDVPPSERLRYTTNEQLFRALSSIRDALLEKQISCDLHVYSEGAEHDFASLKKLPVTLHLNGDQIRDWENLRAADILIVSRSAYSFSAALLSDGIILCPRFWHEPLPDWMLVGKDGAFREEELHSRIGKWSSFRNGEHGA